MNSYALPSFWEGYRALDPSTKALVRKAYGLWAENPFNPLLKFKYINKPESIWAVRISLRYRALGILDSDTITWFWLGDHDDYERHFG